MPKITQRIIVSNRLPFSFDKAKKKLTPASGGLVSALQGSKLNQHYVWIGAAPNDLDQNTWTQLQKKLPDSTRFIPVFLDEALYANYYDGFSNNVLWPLFHYDAELIKFIPKAWEAYQIVNQQFAETILSIAQPNDLIWIHDFHLMLLPALIKNKKPDLKVGFFLHIPFPEPTIFQKLPMHRELLEGLLPADLLGFHLYKYLQNFCSTLSSIMGLSSDLFKVYYNHHTTYLGAFPVSIDTQHFYKQAKTVKVLKLVQSYSHNEFTFLSIERLDYIKGLDLKLKAYRRLLKNYPECREKVLLLQIAIPTRQNVLTYQRLKLKIEKTIHSINDEFKTPHWLPIHYIYDSIKFEELLALYRSSDALIVTSKHDGMNLVVFEYIASQNARNPGLVLLSEFAGATSILSDVIPVNPWDTKETAQKMMLVTKIPVGERIRKHRVMMQYLKKYTAKAWADSFLNRLNQIVLSGKSDPKLIKVETLLDQIKIFSLSEKNPLIIFLDYDGTVVPFAKRPELAKLSKPTYRLFKKISSNKKIKLVVLSGRKSDFLEKQFQYLNIELGAEHGAQYFDPHKKHWNNLVSFNTEEWYGTANHIMEDFTARVPKSFIEKKEFAIVWHYRLSPPAFASQQAIALKETLETALSNLPITIDQGKKMIEVKSVEANKGAFTHWYLKTKHISPHLLALGDDRTDEDLFEIVQENDGLTIKIGSGMSQADYRLASQKSVLYFLEKLQTLKD